MKDQSHSQSAANSSKSINKKLIPKGHILIHEGSTGKDLYWIQNGVMGVYKKSAKGRKMIGKIYSGELVGEMSFLDQETRCATVVAISDCEVIEIPGNKFKELFQTLPPWYQALIRTLLARLRRADALLANAFKNLQDDEAEQFLAQEKSEDNPPAKKDVDQLLKEKDPITSEVQQEMKDKNAA